MIFVKKSEKNTCGLELFTSTKDTKLIINQTISGINNKEEIFIIIHFFVALIILYQAPSD